MSLKLAANIARTHLVAKARQTTIASLGVTFGIAMFILMVSFMTGVNKFLEDTMLTSMPHIRIYNDIETSRSSILEEVKPGEEHMNVVHHQKPKDEKLNLKSGLHIAEQIKKEPGILGVSPQLTSQVFYNYGPTQLTGVLVGVNIFDEDALYDLGSKLKSGSLEALLTSSDGILMGEGLAEKLNVRVGDRVTVATPKGHTILLKVVGTFRIGIGEIDNMRSYASLSTVQKVLQQDPRYITDIHIKLTDLEQAKALAPKLQSMYGYKAEDWETANSSILVSFTIRNVMTYVVVATLLIVAGFGIYNIMSMTIYDKMKDIAILKATGFDGRDIVHMFLLQAIFIGVIGGVVGLLLGFVLSYLLSITPFDAGDFMSIDTFPVNFDPMFYVSGIVFGILTTVLAGYFPAKRASKIDPVSILRG
ncbi:ABC transporter permease [Pontibacter locisalis]|uniref:ABC transporter permease n=1 Tax=Pontibacter locisalis TaxID=1719035 RepID=A0ABW5IN59_9BACT